MSDAIMLSLAAITADSSLQARANLCQTAIADYADAMRNGSAGFPPVKVFFDGEVNWLADGFHRVAAAHQAGLTEISADIENGDKRQAMLFACGSNAAHGLRRSIEDKRRAVQMLIDDDAGLSNREIARRCHVSHTFVNVIRSPKVETFPPDNPCWLPVGDAVATAFYQIGDGTTEGLIVQQSSRDRGFYFVACLEKDGFYYLRKPIAGEAVEVTIGLMLENPNIDAGSLAWRHNEDAAPDVIMGILSGEVRK